MSEFHQDDTNLTYMATTMTLYPRKWFRAKQAPPATADEAGLLTAEEFRRSLELERMRADRGGVGFALLAFQPVPETCGADCHLELARSLKRRLRATDVAGYLDDGRLAALLPATHDLGAHILANHVREALDVEEADLPYEIFLYPQHGPAPFAPPATSAAVPADVLPEIEPQSVDCWFVQPLPMWKRLLDIVGAAAGLVVLAPIILCAGIAIKLTSPGPVFFAQKRTGLGGKVFTMYKLRTMRVDAEALKQKLRVLSEQDGPAFKMKNDPRVTPLGRYLRRSCIDELPQLWNVLKGDMSLVGPRPLPCEEAGKCLGWQQRRLHVTPGLTCIWQVRGPEPVPFSEWMRMDLRYVQTNRPVVDLSLIWRTLVAVITHRASH